MGSFANGGTPPEVVAPLIVKRYFARNWRFFPMTATPAERMRTMRSRRRFRAQREVRLILPDARTEEVRIRVAEGGVPALIQLRKPMRLAGLKAFRSSMNLKRGDLVTVAVSGDFGKPRPAVIVQSDAFPEQHASVIVCQMTSELTDAPDFRVTIAPTELNGLRTASQIMADKPVTVRRARIGAAIGRLDGRDVRNLNGALAFSLGLAD